MSHEQSTINTLMNQGHAIVVFDATTLLTDEPIPLYIPAVDVTVYHKILKQPRHDAKSFKNVVGDTDISVAQTIANERLAVAAKDVILQAIMAFLSSI